MHTSFRAFYCTGVVYRLSISIWCHMYKVYRNIYVSLLKWRTLYSRSSNTVQQQQQKPWKVYAEYDGWQATLLMRSNTQNCVAKCKKIGKKNTKFLPNGEPHTKETFFHFWKFMSSATSRNSSNAKFTRRFDIQYLYLLFWLNHKYAHQNLVKFN